MSGLDLETTIGNRCSVTAPPAFSARTKIAVVPALNATCSLNDPSRLTGMRSPLMVTVTPGSVRPVTCSCVPLSSITSSASGGGFSTPDSILSNEKRQAEENPPSVPLPSTAATFQQYVRASSPCRSEFRAFVHPTVDGRTGEGRAGVHHNPVRLRSGDAVPCEPRSGSLWVGIVSLVPVRRCGQDRHLGQRQLGPGPPFGVDLNALAGSELDLLAAARVDQALALEVADRGLTVGRYLDASLCFQPGGSAATRGLDLPIAGPRRRYVDEIESSLPERHRLDTPPPPLRRGPRPTPERAPDATHNFYLTEHDYGRKAMAAYRTG